MDYPITIMPSKGRLIFICCLAVISLIIVSGMFYLSAFQGVAFGRGNGAEPLFIQGISLIAIIGCLLASYNIIKQLIQNKPIVEINEQGLHINVSSEPVSFIPWSQLKEVVPYKIHNNSFVGINVSNIKSLQGDTSGLKQFLANLNRNYSSYDITIPATYSKQSPEEIVNIIQQAYHNRTA